MTDIIGSEPDRKHRTLKEVITEDRNVRESGYSKMQCPDHDISGKIYANHFLRLSGIAALPPVPIKKKTDGQRNISVSPNDTLDLPLRPLIGRLHDS